MTPRRGLRRRAAQAQGVSAVFAAHARLTRRGRPVRCNRGPRSLGPIIFPSRTAAEAAVAALVELGCRYRSSVCDRGRHWHLHPVIDIEEDAVVAIPHPDEDDAASRAPSWLVASAADAEQVRAEVRERVGDEAPPSPAYDQACLVQGCDSCRGQARWGSVG